MNSRPSVSVVIPTFKRHDEVNRAIQSALAQSLAPQEIIVVNDGPDAEKTVRITALDDPRVRFYEAPRRGIASATRNVGISLAQGDWIALLDDDDIWLPNKLNAQFSALKGAGLSEAILGAREAIYTNGHHLHDKPNRHVPPSTPVDYILFCGYGGLHTSTLMAPTDLFRNCLFDETLVRHEDWAWLLKAGQILPVVVADEVVCERHLAPGEGISRPGGVDFTLQWYHTHSGLMSQRSKAEFVSKWLSRKAAYDWKVTLLPWLFSQIWQLAGMSPRAFLQILKPWLVPHNLRQWRRQLKKKPKGVF